MTKQRPLTEKQLDRFGWRVKQEEGDGKFWGLWRRQCNGTYRRAFVGVKFPSKRDALRAAREMYHCEGCADKRTTIGNVLVHLGEPPHGNPYRNQGGLCGSERASALRLFRDGKDVAKYTFWHAPCSGGARRITTMDEIDWTGMGR